MWVGWYKFQSVTITPSIILMSKLTEIRNSGKEIRETEEEADVVEEKKSLLMESFPL